jgi:AcrR family transcriptional regulator
MPTFRTLVPATARGEATRRKLMDAAIVEFGARGFHAASVSSITSRADVGQGTFYLYFHTKEEIFINIVRDIGRMLRQHVARAVVGSKNRIETERRALVALLRFTLDHPGPYRIVQESQFVDETVFREYYERFAKSYAHDLSEAAQRGDVRPGDAETRAWSILGISQYLALRHCVWTGRMPADSVIDAAVEMIGSGIAPSAANATV